MYELGLQAISHRLSLNDPGRSICSELDLRSHMAVLSSASAAIMVCLQPIYFCAAVYRTTNP